MEEYHVYRVFEGDFADSTSWEGSASYAYCSTMKDTSPVTVTFQHVVESGGDAIVKWTFSSLEDMNAFITFARAGNTDREVVGSPEGQFPGRAYAI